MHLAWTSVGSDAGKENLNANVTLFRHILHPPAGASLSFVVLAWASARIKIYLHAYTHAYMNMHIHVQAQLHRIHVRLHIHIHKKLRCIYVDLLVKV